MSTAHTFKFPFPPSVNGYWRHIVIKGSPRTLISDAGRKYRRAVQRTVLIEHKGIHYSGAIQCDLGLHPPDNRRRDIDNYSKGLLDALAHSGVYDDDSQIKQLNIALYPKLPPGCVYVTLDTIPWG